jgi:hypothetical protein
MRILFVSTLLIGAVACTELEPCDDYIDYMCACHDSTDAVEGEDSEVNCDELLQTLGTADPEVQSQCAIDLSEQQAEDSEEGLECQTSEPL